MATVYITEYSRVGAPQDTGSAAKEPALAYQTVPITGTSTQSNPFGVASNYVRINTDAVCAIAFGGNPTAVGAGGGNPTSRLAANQTEYFFVNPGDRVAVVSSN